MSTLFVVDIDGTIADFGRRLEKAGPEPVRSDKERYAKWVETINAELAADQPVPGMSSLLYALVCTNYGDGDVVYLTGREEQLREITKQWIEHHITAHPAELVMRPNDNCQEIHAFKEDAIDDLLINYLPNAVVVIDDDQSGELEKVCKRRGWTFLKAMSGSGNS